MDDIVTKDNLTEVIIFHLSNLQNDPNPKTVVEDTTISSVLPSTDGFGPANSQQIFKSVIIDTLVENGHAVKLWPAKWWELTVSDLVTKLL